jgi:hypothetical protein
VSAGHGRGQLQLRPGLFSSPTACHWVTRMMTVLAVLVSIELGVIVYLAQRVLELHDELRIGRDRGK